MKAKPEAIRIVTIGGGSGHSQVLKALKDISGVEITAICSSTDSGGSTGILQKAYKGSGYTGDLTKCIVSLCNDAVLADSLLFRYHEGPLHSHSVKNLLFHALEKVAGTDKALEEMWRICGLGNNRVLPVTNKKAELCAKLKIGSTIVGEANIDTIAKNPLWNPNVHSISDIYLKPNVSASKTALQAIKEADYIVICPGDLYSSIIPVLLPKGVKEAIAKSKAPILLNVNIMTKMGETDNYTASDFIKRIEGHLGRRANYILSNIARIPKEVLAAYSLESKVELDPISKAKDKRIISAPLAIITKEKQILSSPEEMRKIFARIIKH
jgi:uncharacterized cofD-like protein